MLPFKAVHPNVFRQLPGQLHVHIVLHSPPKEENQSDVFL